MDTTIDTFHPKKDTPAHRALFDLLHLLKFLDLITEAAVHIYYVDEGGRLPKDATKELDDAAHGALMEAQELLPLAFKRAGIPYPQAIETCGTALRGYTLIIEEMFKLEERIFEQMQGRGSHHLPDSL